LLAFHRLLNIWSLPEVVGVDTMWVVVAVLAGCGLPLHLQLHRVLH
jgi:hypothetical protein